jgi:hypothetical protein
LLSKCDLLQLNSLPTQFVPLRRGWSERVSALRRKRQTAHRLLLRWQHVHLRFYFHRWAAAAAAAAASERVCRKVIARIGGAVGFRVYGLWFMV